MDKIIYNIASYNRPDTLIRAIDSIYNQCDVINLALNGYGQIPEELYDTKINIFLTDNDLGDAYKFYALSESSGYFFTIDDDLIYPHNYTDFMLEAIERYKRKAIITIHGRSFRGFPIKNYYSNDPNLYHFNQTLTQDVKIQFGGTGVMAFHTDLMRIGMNYFRAPNMADVWIGTYAKSNGIDIICARHDVGFVKQQKISESIFENQIRDDRIQTALTNDAYAPKNVSIIMATFDSVEFLDDCITSIVNSCGSELSYELLIGIDACEKTLEYVSTKEYNQFVKFHYFNENVGPYVIKNTLAAKAKSENLIFFDSDDIMRGNMVGDVADLLKAHKCVKPMYHNFKKVLDTSESRFSRSSGLWGEGVFGIKRDLFLHYNGFEGWRCAADSDFMIRLQKNGIRILSTDSLMFYRRIHDKGLTAAADTSYGSELRRHYVSLTNAKKYFGPLDSLAVSAYHDIYLDVNFVLPQYMTPIKPKPVIVEPKPEKAEVLPQPKTPTEVKTAVKVALGAAQTPQKQKNEPVTKPRVLELLKNNNSTRREVSRQEIDEKRQSSKKISPLPNAPKPEKNKKPETIPLKRNAGHDF